MPLMAPNCSTLELPPGEEVVMLPLNSEAAASKAILGSFDSQELEAEEIRDEINRLQERLAQVENHHIMIDQQHHHQQFQ